MAKGSKDDVVKISPLAISADAAVVRSGKMYRIVPCIQDGRSVFGSLADQAVFPTWKDLMALCVEIFRSTELSEARKDALPEDLIKAYLYLPECGRVPDQRQEEEYFKRSDAYQPLAPGEPEPELSYPKIWGGPLTLANRDGKWVLATSETGVMNSDIGARELYQLACFVLSDARTKQACFDEQAQMSPQWMPFMFGVLKSHFGLAMVGGETVLPARQEQTPSQQPSPAEPPKETPAPKVEQVSTPVASPIEEFDLEGTREKMESIIRQHDL